MKVTWLHVSDFHIKGGENYDRDVVLRALVKSVKDFRKNGRYLNMIFATGDVAFSGKPNEYDLATKFFDDLLKAAELEKRYLFVVPGNHDVNRDLGIGLSRTLTSGKEANEYFKPDAPKVHLTQKQGAFVQWYNRYFDGIRTFPNNSTCGPVEAVNFHSLKIGVLPLNSALFCQDDADHERLWIGIDSLDDAIKKIQGLSADINVAIVHHPMDWLNSLERSKIQAKLYENADIIMRGHFHDLKIENVVDESGTALHIAAGAAYETRKWQNVAGFITIEKRLKIPKAFLPKEIEINTSKFSLNLTPIRYAGSPHEVWSETKNEKRFRIQGRAGESSLSSGQENQGSIGNKETRVDNQTNKRAQVFICYCHSDKSWLEKLQVHLKFLETRFEIVYWDDTKIKYGAKWREDIACAIEAAKVAILLLSANFFASKFILKNELPPLLKKAYKEGTLLLLVIVSACQLEDYPELERYQAVNNPESPLNTMKKGKQEMVFKKVAQTVKSHLLSKK